MPVFQIVSILITFAWSQRTEQVGRARPAKCGPKSLYPQTGYWDYLYTCDNKWADPPVYCDAYEGQTGGRPNNDEAYPNAGEANCEFILRKNSFVVT